MRLPILPALLLGLATTATIATLARSAGTPDTSLDGYVLMAVQHMRTIGIKVFAGDVGVNQGVLTVRSDFNAPQSEVVADSMQFQSPAGGCSVKQLFANIGTRPDTPCGSGTPFSTPILGPADLNLRPACHFPTDPMDCPANPPATFINPGNVVTLPPGTYGDIILKSAPRQPGTLIFAGGTYNICGIIRTSSQTRTFFNAPTTIRITGNIRIGDNSYTGPAPGQTVAAGDIQIFSTARAISARQASEIHATICAPLARVHFDQRTTLEGRLAASIISLDQNVVVGLGGSMQTNTTTTTSTSTSTTIKPHDCGNGVRDGNEVCDPPDWGSAACPGSSAIGAFLTCEDNCGRISYDSCPGIHPTTTTTSTSLAHGSTTTSTTIGLCGNGRIDAGEVCDPPFWNGATCPGSTAVGANLNCADNCTRVDTSQCPKAVEICGDCIDNDNNGLTDFEDPACCSHRFPMVVGHGRLVGATDTSRFRLRAVLARAGLARNIDPLTEDVFVQVRAVGTPGDLLCARIPAANFFAKGKVYRFKDLDQTVASARGITNAVVRVRPNGTVGFRAHGKQTKLSKAAPGTLQITVGFRSPKADSETRCSAAAQRFHAGHGGALIAP